MYQIGVGDVVIVFHLDCPSSVDFAQILLNLFAEYFKWEQNTDFKLFFPDIQES